MMKKRFHAITGILLTVAMLTGCGQAQAVQSTAQTAGDQSTSAGSTQTAASETSTGVDEAAIKAALADYKQDTAALTMDNTKWKYDADNDVYYQIGVQYCATPADTDYETLAIYVPGAYMTAQDNGDGTYTCTVNESGKVGNYTASTAPVVWPVNTPGYMAQTAATSYSYDGLSDYLKAGFIYVYAGMRGKSNVYASDGTTLVSSGGVPWGVTDLKAAVRYYRLNADTLPGDADAMFSFGMSGGGAQSALMGASGDSSLYYAYLEKIGAAMTDADGNYISDSVLGSMDWCPITSLDEADEAYEWNMGQFSTESVRADGTFTAALSDDMAKQFAQYINTLGLKDEDGNTLTLEESSDGIYQAGSYYDYMMGVVEISLNHFLSDTTFPYTESTAFNASGNFGGGSSSDDQNSNGIQGSGKTGMGGMPSGQKPSGQMPSGQKPSGQMPSGGMQGASGTGETYDTVQDYIDALNEDGTWIQYDAATNTASITSLKDFVTHCKNATKGVGAFDAVDGTQGENDLFGTASSDSLHFDSIMASLLKQNADTYAQYTDWNASYVTDFADDLAETDELGTDMQTRMNMYNPMYYANATYEGYGTSTLAKYWRIRTGIDQSDTALTTETNLALSLQNDSSVASVDFATVWGMQHTMAERTGDSTTNFISWVNDCMTQETK